MSCLFVLVRFNNKEFRLQKAAKKCEIAHPLSSLKLVSLACLLLERELSESE